MRLAWLLLVVLAEAEVPECLAGGVVIDPETLSAFAWQKLAQNESQNFYRCLHDVHSLAGMLHGLYFGEAESATSVVIPDAPGLGTIWLNPAVKEHHLWYRHGSVNHRVVVEGSTVKKESFPNYDSCDTSMEVICTILEVAPQDDVCINADDGCRGHISDLMKELQVKQAAVDAEMKAGDFEGAYCTLASLAAGDRQALTWYSGTAQCLLTSCGDGEDTLIHYEALYACSLQGSGFGAAAVCLLLLFYYFILMGVVADGYLVPVLIQIGRGLKMSDALLGATLLALGGSANDFMIGFVSALTNSASEESEDDVRLWLGGVFGTGVFINTFVASLVLLFSGPEGVQVSPSVLSRDIGFRMLAVALMILFGYLGYVSTFMAAFMNLLYVLYVILSLRESRSAPERGSFSQASMSFQGRGSRTAVSFEALCGQSVCSAPAAPSDEMILERIKRHAGWEEEMGLVERLSFLLALPLRPFMALTMASTTWDGLVHPLVPLGLGVFVPFGISGSAGNNLYTKAFGGDSAWISRVTILTFWALGLCLSLLVWSLARRQPKQYVAQAAFSWATFLSSLLWVALLANEVVGCMQLLGAVLGLEPMPMGITLLAWGNCVDNVFGLLGLAKAGEFRVAITGIYAGPMFNVLFGNGSILLLSSLLQGGATRFIMSPCGFVLLGALEVILAATLLYSKLCSWRMSRGLGVALGAVYPLLLLLGFGIEYGLFPST